MNIFEQIERRQFLAGAGATAGAAALGQLEASDDGVRKSNHAA